MAIIKYLNTLKKTLDIKHFFFNSQSSIVELLKLKSSSSWKKCFERNLWMKSLSKRNRDFQQSV